ncbi:hypothetical protein HanPI659440_Chr13g0509581 [Helianthus annuus]|nr:hypothetical protein HanPI659440_Chr13g0509581 [Helianthus annuus]
MFVAHTEITNLKARVDSLKKSEADYKEKYEEAKSHRERVKVLQIANSILNATKLDLAVAALTVVSRAAGLRAGYLECAAHVEESLHTQWGTHHCSVSE